MRLSLAIRSIGLAGSEPTLPSSAEDSERQRAILLQQEMLSSSLLDQMASSTAAKVVEAQTYRTATEGYAAATRAIAA